MATAESVRERLAGQLVIDETLRVQCEAEPRTRLQCAFGRSPLAENAVSWYRGALGEIAVGNILAQLPEGWHARHALPVGTRETDIDHLVVGPGGVFTINTKHHAGKRIWVAGRTLLVDGQYQQYIRNATGEAGRVAKLLGERMPHPVHVHPLLVMVDPKSITVKAQPERVQVLNSHEVRRWLRQQPATLNPAAVAVVLAVIDDPTVWRQVDDGDPAASRAQFAVLHDEVRSASRRRRLWAASGTLLLAATVVGAYLALVSALL